MRSILLVLVCIAGGYGIAVLQTGIRNQNVTHIKGPDGDMDKIIEDRTVPEAQAGKIQVAGGTTFDFGTMKQGSSRSHKFEFKNVGAKPVLVQFKESSCKCTVGNFKEATLQPGESTEVELKWIAEKALPDFAQTATIATDAPGQEEIKLTIRGKIGQSHVFSPADHDFGDFLATDEHVFKGKIYSFEEKPMDFNSINWSISSMAKYVMIQRDEVKKLQPGEIPEHADAKQMMDFIVTLRRGFPPGRFEGSVAFQASEESDTHETLYFPMRGKCVSVISIVGGVDYNEDTNILNMGTASTRVGLKKSIVIKVRKEGDATPTIKVAEILPPEVAAVMKVEIGQVKESAKQSLFPVTFEIPPGSPPVSVAGTFGKDFAKIVFETNVESAPQFPIYIKLKTTE